MDSWTYYYYYYEAFFCGVVDSAGYIRSSHQSPHSSRDYYYEINQFVPSDYLSPADGDFVERNIFARERAEVVL